MDPEIEKIHEYVRATLGRPGSHGLDHVERVTAMCRRIGQEEHADMAVLIPAALLHDIARPREREQGIPHEQEGARMAEEFLRSIEYDGNRIPAITHAIRTHRYRSREKPGSPEAQILSDADKLDAMGAVGIARTFMRAGEHGGSVHDGIDHFHDKLLKLPDLMYTGTARRIAGERYAFLSRFLEILEEELSVSQD